MKIPNIENKTITIPLSEYLDLVEKVTQSDNHKYKANSKLVESLLGITLYQIETAKKNIFQGITTSKLLSDLKDNIEIVLADRGIELVTGPQLGQYSLQVRDEKLFNKHLEQYI